MYHSFVKEHLTSAPEGGGGGVGTLSSVSHTKVRPCHVYSDSMPSKQIIGQTITFNKTTSGFKVES